MAVVRVRHTISATQTTTVGQATELGGLRVPLAASQTVAADQTGTARARYTLAALQTINVADTADLRPQLAAANTVTVTGTATSRPRHTLTGTNSAATSSAATATLVTFTRQRMQNGSVSNSFLPYVQVTGFTSDPTYPATVTNNALVVKGAGNVTLTWSATGNGNIKIQRNGVDVGSVGLTGTVSLTVAAGDQLTMWHASNGGPQSVSGCWINITPHKAPVCGTPLLFERKFMSGRLTGVYQLPDGGFPPRDSKLWIRVPVDRNNAGVTVYSAPTVIPSTRPRTRPPLVSTTRGCSLRVRTRCRRRSSGRRITGRSGIRLS
ncbi:hypothetical protein SAMN04488548_10815 [Gordonia westfalica]|uniref:Uncharacterized protein n=1 Tax=Gordonia westfalica TaxID=158898 RepID=A0A1H2DN52_9ACTN|nr:hypothetical protein SAMN04488548_10815 [Gordonia westfalica]